MTGQWQSTRTMTNGYGAKCGQAHKVTQTWELSIKQENTAEKSSDTEESTKAEKSSKSWRSIESSQWISMTWPMNNGHWQTTKANSEQEQWQWLRKHTDAHILYSSPSLSLIWQLRKLVSWVSIEWNNMTMTMTKSWTKRLTKKVVMVARIQCQPPSKHWGSGSAASHQASCCAPPCTSVICHDSKSEWMKHLKHSVNYLTMNQNSTHLQVQVAASSSPCTELWGAFWRSTPAPARWCQHRWGSLPWVSSTFASNHLILHELAINPH